MTTPTIIRVWQEGNVIATVTSVSTPHGFTCHFQVYRLYENHHTTYEYGMPWSGEPKAVDQFDRFVKIRTDKEVKREYHTYQGKNAHRAACVTNYIKSRKSEGYDHSVAKSEARFFYQIGG